MTKPQEPIVRTPEVAEVKLSPREALVKKYEAKLEKHKQLSEELQEIFAAIESIDALASISEGSAVIITVGKGETFREVEGVVTGVKAEADGTKLYKVQYGSGFDTSIAIVRTGKIKPVKAEAPAAE